MQEEFKVIDDTPSTPPITPDNCDLVICYDYKTGEIVPYLVNMTPKDLTNEQYHKGMLDVGNWIVKGAISAGILQESSKRSRGTE